MQKCVNLSSSAWQCALSCRVAQCYHPHSYFTTVYLGLHDHDWGKHLGNFSPDGAKHSTATVLAQDCKSQGVVVILNCQAPCIVLDGTAVKVCIIFGTYHNPYLRECEETRRSFCKSS